jgi:hypothetical protein
MRNNPLTTNERDFNACKIRQDWIKALCPIALLIAKLAYMIDKTTTKRSEVFTDF